MRVLDLIDQLNDWAQEKGDLQIKLALDAFYDKEWDNEMLLEIDGAQYHEGEVPRIVIV